MKIINIKNLELNIDLVQVLNLYSMNYTIIIDVDGNIYTDENDVKSKAVVFKSENKNKLSSILDAKSLANNLFSAYKPQVNGTTCKIKPLTNWQNIIDMNKDNMLYFDHQSDGVELFEDKTLEDYGWHAIVLEVDYRMISEFIEKNCEGVLLCYDNEIQFSGFTITDNIEDIRVQVKEFIIQKANENMKNELFEIDEDDVLESLEFFGIKV